MSAPHRPSAGSVSPSRPLLETGSSSPKAGARTDGQGSKQALGYGGAVARLCVFLAFALLLLALVIRQAHNQAVLLVLPGVCMATALHLLPVFVSRRADLFSPVSYTGLYDGLGLIAALSAMMVSGHFDLGPFNGFPIERQVSLFNQVCALHMVSRIGYLLGYYNYAALGVKLHTSFPRLAGRQWQPRRLFLVLMILTAIFAVTYAIFQSRLNVSLFDITQLRAGKAVWRDDQTLSWMVRGTLLGLLPATFIFAWALRRPRTQLIASLLVFLVVAFLVVRTGQRGAPAFAAVVLLILFHYLKRPVPSWLFFAGFFGALIAINVLGDLRNDPEVDVGRVAMASVEDPANAMATHAEDRQRLTGLAVIMYFFPDHKGFLLGESWKGMAGLFVPRWIWPDKNSSLIWSDSGLIVTLSGLPIPAPLPGVLYANFAWAGVFVGMALWGFFHRSLYEWHQGNPHDLNVVVVYSLVLVHFAPLMVPLAATIQYVIPGLITILFVSKKPISRLGGSVRGAQAFVSRPRGSLST